MSIICKVDRRKKISDSTISLYRYTIAGDTKDKRITNQSEKLSYVYSSSELPYFDNKKINDVEYLNERKKTISNNFDNALNMRMHGSKSKFNNRFAHFIIAPSADEYGKHSNEKMVEMSKDAFCDFYQIPIEDFLGTVVIHETNENGIKKNDIHVIGATADKEGKKNVYFAKGQLLKKLQKTSRKIEEKHNLSKYDGDIKPKNGNKSKAIKNITKQEIAYKKNHGEFQALAHIKYVLSKNIHYDFETILDKLNEEGINILSNVNDNREITGMSFHYYGENIKLSQVKATRLEGEKLTSKRFIEEQLGYDKNRDSHYNRIQNENIESEENSSISLFFNKENLQIDGNKNKNLCPDPYWNNILTRLDNGRIGMNGKNIGVIEESNRVIFTDKSLTTLKVATLMAIEKFNKSKVEGEYHATLSTNTGSLSKQKIYLIIEELKNKEPEKYRNVELGGYKPSKKLIKQAQDNANRANIRKDILIRLSKINKSILPENRSIDLSDLSKHNAYIAYEILLEEKARNPDKFHLVSIEGYEPTFIQSLKENDKLDEYYNQVRDKAMNNWLNENENYVRAYGYQFARSEAYSYASIMVNKEKKRRKKAIKQAEKDFDAKYNTYLSHRESKDNLEFFSNEQLNNDYLEYLELTADSEEVLSPNEYLDYIKKTTRIKDDNPIKIIDRNTRKRKTQFSI